MSATKTKTKTLPLPDLYGPFITEPLLEVRRAKMTPMPDLKTIFSGIDKLPIPNNTRYWVNTVGLPDDEHDLTFHGGPDKALHHYCSEHYPLWREKYPQSAHLFVPGGFGENLVTKAANEHNVCIGDIIRMGPSLRVQASLPRQPCFKLNHRFKLRNFTSETYKVNRTGWYYRVLSEGDIGVGDMIELEERKYPLWTIARIQHYLYIETSVNERNENAYTELAAIEELGHESRKIIRRRLADYQARKSGLAGKNEVKWIDYRIVDIQNETKAVKKIVLEAVEKMDKAKAIIGSYVRIKLTDSLIRAYSVISGNPNTFALGVALDPTSKRGGSRYIHDTLKIGDVHAVAEPIPSVVRSQQASHHIFIAGGIGVTAFLPLWEIMDVINCSIEIHWAVRSPVEAPFKDKVELYGDRVHIYDNFNTGRMNIRNIIEDRKWNSYIYVCAGTGISDEVRRTSNEFGITDQEIHYEAFQAESGGDPFTVEVKGKEDLGRLEVGSEETLLQVLRGAGLSVDSSCEVGNCGTCEVKVCSGDVMHRGTSLGKEEEDGEKGMLSCVSRGIGHIVIEVEG